MINALEEILDFLKCEHSNLTKGIFQLSVNFTNDKITLNPDLDTILATICDITDNLINLIQEVYDINYCYLNNARQAPRILYMNVFSEYFKGRPIGINLIEIINTDSYFIRLKEKIKQIIVNDYHQALNYLKVKIQ